MSAMAASANSSQRWTWQVSSGSMQSSTWCGTPRCSSSVAFAVPMHMARYTAIASAFTTSPPSPRANSTAKDVFPDAVGPNTKINGIGALLTITPSTGDPTCALPLVAR
jgi:hypothetical protein